MGKTINDEISSIFDEHKVGKGDGMSSDERFTIRYNQAKGDLKYYDCPKCKNKGKIAIFDKATGRYNLKECECMPMRRSLKGIYDDGMTYQLQEFTFDTYVSKTEWQKEYLGKALEFGNQNTYKMFFMGGTSGAGKSHLCTALYGDMIHKNLYECKYMLWNETARRLVALQYDDPYKYVEEIKQYYDTKLLYIDDFLKPFKDGDNITNSALSIAYDIINHRYSRSDLLTIVSSEKTMREIFALDKAIAGRIWECTGNGKFTIKIDGDDKNVRIHPELIKF